MAWWTSVPDLTPIAAWDANAVGSGKFVDRVGTNGLVRGPTSFDVELACVAGNSNRWPLDTPITFPTEYTIFSFVKCATRHISFCGTESYTHYMMDVEPDGKVYNSYSSYSALTGYPVPVFGSWRLQAVVKRSATAGFAVAGSWLVGENALPLNTLFPTLWGVGYNNNGDEYNFDSVDKVCAMGVFEGAATLSQLATLEAAIRSEVVGPPLGKRGGLLPLNRRVMHPHSLVPGNSILTQGTGRVQVRGYWKWDNGPSGGIIRGKVTVENIPAARQVRLYDKKNGLLIKETFSKPNGDYEFLFLDPRREYFVVSHDHLRTYNAVISDMIDPP